MFQTPEMNAPTQLMPSAAANNRPEQINLAGDIVITTPSTTASSQTPTTAAPVVLAVPPPGLLPATGDIEEWRGCSPSQIVLQLRRLNAEAIGNNTKKFYTSYPAWESMTADQKSKTYAFYLKLTHGVKQAVLNQAKQATTEAAEAAKARKENTSKEDLVRLLHLRKEPCAQLAWSRTEEALARRALDARNSIDAPTASGVGSLADEADPFGELASIFNNYDAFCPCNDFVAMVPGTTTPCVPARPVDPDYTTIVANTGAVNPSDRSRASITRDGAWIKEQWIKLKSYLTAVFADFERSGKQASKGDAEVEWMSESECTRWVYHANNNNRPYPTVVIYAYALMDKSDFDNLGRVLPLGIGRDESVRSAAVGASIDGPSAEAAEKKRKRGGRNKKGDDDEDEEDVGSLAAALVKIGAMERADAAKRFLYEHGSEEDKQAVLSEARRLAGLGRNNGGGV